MYTPRVGLVLAITNTAAHVSSPMSLYHTTMGHDTHWHRGAVQNGSLVVDRQAVAEHHTLWQTGAAKAANIQTHPCLGVGSIGTVRTLFEPAVQRAFIYDLVEVVLVSCLWYMCSELATCEHSLAVDSLTGMSTVVTITATVLCHHAIVPRVMRRLH